MNYLRFAIICLLFLDCSLAWSENRHVGGDKRNSLLAVVQHLMSESKQALKQGDLDLANSTLERAIRIDRKNPWLWHNLAILRVRQKMYAKAIQLALKANDESSQYSQAKVQKLQLNNWKLIHFCHLELGESKKAKKAMKFIQKLSL